MWRQCAEMSGASGWLFNLCAKYRQRSMSLKHRASSQVCDTVCPPMETIRMKSTMLHLYNALMRSISACTASVKVELYVALAA
jgi:hypothetical protein